MQEFFSKILKIVILHFIDNYLMRFVCILTVSLFNFVEIAVSFSENECVLHKYVYETVDTARGKWYNDIKKCRNAFGCGVL